MDERLRRDVIPLLIVIAAIVVVGVAGVISIGVDGFGTEAGRRAVSADAGSPSPPAIAATAETIRSPRTSSDAGADRTDAVGRAVAVEMRRIHLNALASMAEERGEWADSVLADAALAHPEPPVREEAVHLLGERGGMIALETLRQALQDPSRRVRRAAIRSLADVGGDQAVAAIGELADSNDVAMRLEVADALGEIGGPGATQHLERFLHDESDVVREAAAEWTRELSRAKP